MMADDFILTKESILNELIPKGRGKKYWKRMLTASLISANILLLALGVHYLIFINTSKLTTMTTAVSVVKPISIRFNKRVAHDASVQLFPANGFGLQWTDSLIQTDLQLVPTDRWLTNTRYTVTVNGVKTAFNQAVPAATYTFVTQTAPTITSASPANDTSNVPIDSTLILNLDSPNENLISPKVTISPETTHELVLSADKTSYRVNFPDKLKQSTDYSITVYDTFRQAENQDLKIFTTSFHTVPKVQISAFSPTGSMNLKNSIVKVTFDNDMDKKSVESGFSVTPSTEAGLSWDDNRTFVFTPKSPLTLDTQYNFLLPAGTKNTLGGTLESDYAASFRTIGHVSASFSPGWGASEVALNSPVKVYFNQEVDRASAQNAFSISPNTGGSFSWYGNTMIFTPTGQGYLTNYRPNVAAGVGSINGLPSVSAFSTSYTTLTPVVMLNVPFYRQRYNLSCEVAALRMALAEKGVSTSEDQLLGILGHDGPDNLVGGVWGNPFRGFVGNVNGNGTTTGYGVHWDPIASVGSQFRTSNAFGGGNLQTLTAAIDGGNPVIIWGTIGRPNSMSWSDYLTGSLIAAVKGEHARVVKGYKGLASNPLGFYIVDPIYGNLYWSSSALLGNWGWFGNSGVIVY